VERVWRSEFEYDLLGWAQSALNCLIRPPNLFFHRLTRRPVEAGPITAALSYLLGGLLLISSLPLAWGGTLIFSGKRSEGG
jgi:hypothetical protein